MLFSHQNQRQNVNLFFDSKFCYSLFTRVFFWLIAFQVIVFFFITNHSEATQASFYANPSIGPAPLTVQFFDQSSSSYGIDSRNWDFGDGEATSDETNPIHTYQKIGKYVVTLTVLDYYHYSYKATQTVMVTNTPDQPTLLSPEDGTANVSRTPMLQTGVFSDLDFDERHLSTQWQISTSQDFSTIILDSTSLSHLTSLMVPQLVLLENTTYYWRVRFYDSNTLVSEWSEIFSFTTLTTQDDLDSNGIPDVLENNSVDLDNDGVADIGQTHIKSLNTAIGSGQMGVSVKGASTVTSNPEINAIDPETISQVSLPQVMPFGLFGMRLNVTNPGDVAEVIIYFSQAAEQNAVWYLYDSINGWVDYSSYATFSQDRKSVTLKLKDGDYGDADGVANGIIVDPCGFGIASWVKGFVSDSITEEPITTATVNLKDLNLSFNSVLEGNYLGMVLPGTYDFDISADGYELKAVSDIAVSEASIVTTDVQLVKKVKITGLTISGAQQIFNNITFSVNAESQADKLYYRFSVHPDYGTDDYNGLQWTSMTSTEWVTTSSIKYQFKSNGKYIVVVWVTTDPQATDTSSVAILGSYIEIGGTCTSDFKEFSMTGSQKKDTPITIFVDCENSCSNGLYYRYSVHPDYGTSGYDGLHWSSMTTQEWWTNETINYTFTEKGKYIVVIWAARSLSGIDPTGIPILGWSVDIE